jgi:hypothetical protein
MTRSGGQQPQRFEWCIEWVPHSLPGKGGTNQEGRHWTRQSVLFGPSSPDLVGAAVPVPKLKPCPVGGALELRFHRRLVPPLRSQMLNSRFKIVVYAPSPSLSPATAVPK